MEAQGVSTKLEGTSVEAYTFAMQFQVDQLAIDDMVGMDQNVRLDARNFGCVI